MNESPSDDVVPGRSGSPGGWREFLRTEDAWAIWIGFLLIALGALFYLPRPPEQISEKLAALDGGLEIERARAPFRTLEWHRLSAAKAGLKSSSHPTAKKLSGWLPKLQKWRSSPAESFVLSEDAARERNAKAQAALPAFEEKTAELRELAATAEQAAGAAGFRDAELNAEAARRIGEHQEQLTRHKVASKKSKSKPYNQLGMLAAFGLFAALVLSLGIKCMGRPVGSFLRGFSAVYLLAVLSYVFASQADVKAAGFGYAA